jgi:hypothetical protein
MSQPDQCKAQKSRQNARISPSIGPQSTSTSPSARERDLVFERVVGFRPSQHPRGVAKAIRSVEWHGRRPQHGQGNAGAGFTTRGFELTEFKEAMVSGLSILSV